MIWLRAALSPYPSIEGIGHSYLTLGEVLLVETVQGHYCPSLSARVWQTCSKNRQITGWVAGLQGAPFDEARLRSH